MASSNDAMNAEITFEALDSLLVGGDDWISNLLEDCSDVLQYGSDNVSSDVSPQLAFPCEMDLEAHGNGDLSPSTSGSAPPCSTLTSPEHAGKESVAGLEPLEMMNAEMFADVPSAGGDTTLDSTFARFSCRVDVVERGTSGPCNATDSGSKISIVGRSPVFSTRELPRSEEFGESAMRQRAQVERGEEVALEPVIRHQGEVFFKSCTNVYYDCDIADIKPEGILLESCNGSAVEVTSSGGLSCNENGGSDSGPQNSAAGGGKKSRKKGGDDGRVTVADGNVKEEGHSDGSDGCNGDMDAEKKQARLVRNRESAQLSRQRKKYYVDELESRLRTMQATVAELNTTISHLTSENVNLRRRLALYCSPAGVSGGRHVGPPMMPLSNGMAGAYGLYGMPSMGLPGAVPSVAIPRLKANRNLTAGKGAKRSKASAAAEKDERGKSRKRIKSAAGGAGVVALALFCFAMVFGPLQSVDDIRQEGAFSVVSLWEGSRSLGSQTAQFLGGGRGGGRVLMSIEEPQQWANETFGMKDGNGSIWEKSNLNDGHEKLPYTPANRKSGEWREGGSAFDKEKAPRQTLTEALPVPASLFVPRNDQLVKIDGNLIIRAIMAGDKAASLVTRNTEQEESVKPREEEYDVGKNALKAVEIQQLKAMAMLALGGSKGRVEALPSASKLAESNEVEGKQGGQWFLGGVAGPILGSEKCFEVFRFEKYPNAPVRAAEAEDSHSHDPHNSSHVAGNDPVVVEEVQGRLGGRRLGRRRYSAAVPLPPVASKNESVSSVKESHDMIRNCDGDGPCRKEKRHKSMVVSVLASPFEAADHREPSEDRPRDEGQARSSISRIFVVVLVNGVKYITYSCMLPTLGAGSTSLSQT